MVITPMKTSYRPSNDFTISLFGYLIRSMVVPKLMPYITQ